MEFRRLPLKCCCHGSVTRSCPTLWPHVAHQASLSFTISQFAQTHVHWVRDAIQPSHPLLPVKYFMNISCISYILSSIHCTFRALIWPLQFLWALELHLHTSALFEYWPTVSASQGHLSLYLLCMCEILFPLRNKLDGTAVRIHLPTQEMQERRVRSLDGEGGNGNPIQYSCLGSSMEREAWRASLWGRKESDTTQYTITRNKIRGLSKVSSVNYLCSSISSKAKRRGALHT